MEENPSECDTCGAIIADIKRMEADLDRWYREATSYDEFGHPVLARRIGPNPPLGF